MRACSSLLNLATITRPERTRVRSAMSGSKPYRVLERCRLINLGLCQRFRETDFRPGLAAEVFGIGIVRACCRLLPGQTIPHVPYPGASSLQGIRQSSSPLRRPRFLLSLDPECSPCVFLYPKGPSQHFKACLRNPRIGETVAYFPRASPPDERQNGLPVPVDYVDLHHGRSPEVLDGASLLHGDG